MGQILETSPGFGHGHFILPRSVINSLWPDLKVLQDLAGPAILVIIHLQIQLP